MKKQGLDESFFLLYSDNDLLAFLLTEKEYKIIEERFEDEPVEIPYRPDNL